LLVVVALPLSQKAVGEHDVADHYHFHVPRPQHLVHSTAVLPVLLGAFRNAAALVDVDPLKNCRLVRTFWVDA
jgi:hypothetical protein